MPADDAVTGTQPATTNNTGNASPTPDINPSDIVEESESAGHGKGLDNNNVKNKGVVFPLIRINDHICLETEIKEFYIESGYFKDYHEYKTIKMAKTGFVPTMHLVLSTTAPDLLKSNQIKSGDKCGVFFSNGGGPIKSYRADYIIKSVVTTEKPSEVTDIPVIFIIEAELFVPNLRNEAIRYNFNGSSRDALFDAALRLGLGFNFCDPENTDDYQGWVCQTNLYDYCCDVAAHAWKEFDAFYDCWIDPRYGLSFINMNTMLVADGFDEPLDLTPFVNMIHSSVGIDGDKVSKSEQEKKNNPQPQVKIATNIVNDMEAVTPFYIKKWNIVNRAAEITHEIGINSAQSMNIDNPGVTETENTNVDMNYSIPINMKKLLNGFFVLIGPGVNLTYTQADLIDPNMSFVRSSYTIGGGGITEVMSNDDAAQMEANGNNMLSSGNTNRFYDAGFEHNVRNLLQLLKLYTEVELMGLNLGIMRGEKLPILILDNDKMLSAARSGNFTGSMLMNLIYELASGWYVIDGIMWEWKPSNSLNGSTLWNTKVKLVRREWPIPGRLAVDGLSNNEIVQEHTVDASESASNGNTATPSATIEGLTGPSGYSSDGGNFADSDGNDVRSNSIVGNSEVDYSATNATAALDVDLLDKTTADEVPLTGLRDELKNVYMAIKNICPGIKIVSARRWAVDESGNRRNGNAFVERNGLYKVANAKGEIMYFKNANSKHMYGEAFDIINSLGQDFNSIMTDYVMQDRNVLQLMVRYGISACIEQTTDDSGASTKHYHFGTDENIMNSFWSSVLAVNKSLDGSLVQEIKSVSALRKKYAMAEINNTSVEEDVVNG